MIAWHGWGQVPDALRAGNLHFPQKLPIELTDSSIKVARFFLYKRAVPTPIADPLFGWTNGRLFMGNKVCRAVLRRRHPEPSVVPSIWSGSILTSVWFDLRGRRGSRGGSVPDLDPVTVLCDTITSNSSRYFFALRAVIAGPKGFELACI